MLSVFPPPRIVFAFILLLALFPGRCPRAEDLPSLPETGVIVPWEDFRKILEDLRVPPDPDPPRPPVDAALSGCSLDATVNDEESQARVVLSFQIRVLEETRWTQVPILREGMALSFCSLDGSPAAVYRSNGFLTLALKGRGSHRVEVEYRVPVANQRGARSFRLRFPPCPVLDASVTLPRTDIDVQAAGAVVYAADRSGNRTQLRAAFRGNGDADVSWTQRIEADERESKVQADVASLVTVGEGLLRGTTTASYTIHGQGVDLFRIAHPADITVMDVHAAGIREWKDVPAEGMDEPSVLHVRLNYRAKREFSFQVHFEKTLEQGTPVRTSLPDLRVLDVMRDRGHVALAAATNLEIRPEGQVRNASPVDPSELPPALLSGGGDAILYAFKYLRHPVEMELKIVRHEDMEVQQTIVESADLVTFVSPEGKLVTSARYRIKNNRRQYLSLRLPEGSELWGAYLEDRPVKPSRRKDGSLLVPLKKTPTGSDGDAEAFPVEIVYFQRGTPLRALRSLAPRGPCLDVDIMELCWELYLPRDRRYFSFGGNLKEDHRANRLLYLGSTGYNLSRAEDLGRLSSFEAGDGKDTYVIDGTVEIPLGEVRYRRDGKEVRLGDAELRSVLDEAAGKHAPAKRARKDQSEEVDEARMARQQTAAPLSNVYTQANLAMDQVVLPATGKARGVLPVRIRIPREGLRVSFVGRILTEGEVPSVTFRQASASWRLPALGGGWVFLLTLLAVFVLWLCLASNWEAVEPYGRMGGWTGGLLLAAVLLLSPGHRTVFICTLLAGLAFGALWTLRQARRAAEDA